jgi:hypothetical protein
VPQSLNTNNIVSDDSLPLNIDNQSSWKISASEKMESNDKNNRVLKLRTPTIVQKRRPKSPPKTVVFLLFYFTILKFLWNTIC